VVADVAAVEDLRVPLRGELEDAIDRVGEPWDTGPYAARAHALLAVNAADLARLLPTFDALATRVMSEPERFVLTHGKPGAHNVLASVDGYRLVDWDSARLAAPERGLWSLNPGDGSALATYRTHGGPEIRDHALDAYRVWYDLLRSPATSSCSGSHTSTMPMQLNRGRTWSTSCSQRQGGRA
jgi:hypothetical protein